MSSGSPEGLAGPLGPAETRCSLALGSHRRVCASDALLWPAEHSHGEFEMGAGGFLQDCLVLSSLNIEQSCN